MENLSTEHLGKAGRMRTYAEGVGHKNGATELTSEATDGVRDFGAGGVSAVAGHGSPDGSPAVAGSNSGAAAPGMPAGSKANHA